MGRYDKISVMNLIEYTWQDKYKSKKGNVLLIYKNIIGIL